jgi:peptidoglycan/xylan/chitin deacetylase (PgdA/CDA1 family)
MLGTFRSWRQNHLRRRGVLILLYHRIAQLRRDPWSLCISPKQFEQQLSVLGEQSCPIRLQDLKSHLSGSPNPQSPILALTFDDGYADNLLAAEPLLRKFEIPATMFVVCRATNRDREFWWDELERILLEPLPNPRSLRLMIHGMWYEWLLGADSNGSAVTHDGWQAWGTDTPSAVHKAYRQIYNLLLPLAPSQRNEVMDQLSDWAGVDRTARPSHRLLSEDQLACLAHSDFIDIGVHTMEHPVLASLSVIDQMKEIGGAKMRIERIIGKTSLLFSYPYGKRNHYGKATVEIVRRTGFEYACTNVPGMVAPGTDVLQLPRVIVPALDGPAFRQWLMRSFVRLH